MRIVAFAGLKGSGKDECAKPLIEDGWTHLKFADPLWDCLLALDVEVKYLGCDVRLNGVIEKMGREEAKKAFPVVRKYLERIGTEMGRDVIDQDIWVNHMRGRIESVESLAVKNQAGDYVGVQDPRIVITDVRFDNEADLIHKMGGQILLVRRPGIVQGEHRSEALAFDTDATILNAGTIEELWADVRSYVERDSK